MKKLLLSILILILFSGCSNVYNLSNFVVPNDLEFIAVIESVNTPKKIAAYMNENFTHKRNAKYAPDPYTFWLDPEGDCNDYATWGMFAAHWHNYPVWRVDIWYSDDTGHSITVYEEEKLSFTDYEDYEFGFNIIREIVEKYYMESMYIGYRAYDYNNRLIEEGGFGQP